MLWAYQQRLDPLADKLPASSLFSIVFAALPVVVLFWLLVPRRWLAPKAGAMAALTALVVAVTVYGMPPVMAGMAFVNGALFGLLPVGWTIFNAMLLYNVTVQTGKFDIVRRSVAGLSGDARIQAILIGFSFGAFLEGAAGGGTPVAICGAIMVGLGFNPFLAAVLCLIANTSPVAYGGLGTPILVLSGVTGIKDEMLSTMAGHQLPVLSLLVPAYMVKCMCSWKRTLAVWPALLVSGGSFAVFQYVFATMHDRFPGVVLFPMTDIGGGIFSLVVTAIFLQFWKPKDEWHFTTPTEPSFSGAAGLHAITAQAPYAAITEQPPAPISSVQLNASDPHAAEAMALMGGASKQAADNESKPLTMGNVTLAWMPFILMSVLLMLTGIVRQKEGHGPIPIGATGIQTNYMIPVPTLHNEALRAEILRPVGKEKEAESALFNFAWLTAPGTAVFLAALLSMALFRMSPMQIGVVMRRTIV